MQAIDPCQIALLAVIRFLFPRKQDNSPGKSVPLALYTHLLDHVYEVCITATAESFLYTYLGPTISFVHLQRHWKNFKMDSKTLPAPQSSRPSYRSSVTA